MRLFSLGCMVVSNRAVLELPKLARACYGTLRERPLRKMGAILLGGQYGMQTAAESAWQLAS